MSVIPNPNLHLASNQKKTLARREIAANELTPVRPKRRAEPIREDSLINATMAPLQRVTRERFKAASWGGGGDLFGVKGRRYKLPERSSCRVLIKTLEESLKKGDLGHALGLLKVDVHREHLLKLPASLRKSILKHTADPKFGKQRHLEFIFSILYSDHQALKDLEEIFKADPHAATQTGTCDCIFDYLETKYELAEPENLVKYPLVANAYFTHLPLQLSLEGRKILSRGDDREIALLNHFLSQCTLNPRGTDFPEGTLKSINELVRSFTEENRTLNIYFCRHLFDVKGVDNAELTSHLAKTHGLKLDLESFTYFYKELVSQGDHEALKHYLSHDTQGTSLYGVAVANQVSMLYRKAEEKSANALKVARETFHYFERERIPLDSEDFFKFLKIADETKDSQEGKELYGSLLRYAALFFIDLPEEAMVSAERDALTGDIDLSLEILGPFLHYMHSGLDLDLTQERSGAILERLSQFLALESPSEQQVGALEGAISAYLSIMSENHSFINQEAFELIAKLINKSNLNLELASRLVLLAYEKNTSCEEGDPRISLPKDEVAKMLVREDLHDQFLVDAFHYIAKEKIDLELSLIQEIYQIAAKDGNDFAQGVFCMMLYMTDHQKELVKENLDSFWEITISSPKLTGIRTLLQLQKELGVPVSAEHSAAFWKGLEKFEDFSKMCRVMLKHPEIKESDPIDGFLDYIIQKTKQERLDGSYESKKPYVFSKAIACLMSIGPAIPMETLTKWVEKIDADDSLNPQDKDALYGCIWERIIEEGGAVFTKDFMMQHIQNLIAADATRTLHYVACYLRLSPFSVSFDETYALISALNNPCEESVKDYESVLVSLTHQLLFREEVDAKRLEDLVKSSIEAGHWLKVKILLRHERMSSIQYSPEVLQQAFSEAFDAKGEDAHTNFMIYSLLSEIFEIATARNIELDSDCESSCYRLFIKNENYDLCLPVLKYSQNLRKEKGAEHAMNLRYVHTELFNSVADLGYESLKANDDFAKLSHAVMEFLLESGEDAFLDEVKFLFNSWDDTACIVTLGYLLPMIRSKDSGIDLEKLRAFMSNNIAHIFDLTDEGLSDSKKKEGLIQLAYIASHCIYSLNIDIVKDPDGLSEGNYEFADYFSSLIEKASFGEVKEVLVGVLLPYLVKREALNSTFTREKQVELVHALLVNNIDTVELDNGIPELIEVVVVDPEDRISIFADIVIKVANDPKTECHWQKVMTFLAESYDMSEETLFVNHLKELKAKDETRLPETILDWLTVADELLGDVTYQGIEYEGSIFPKAPLIPYRKLATLYTTYIHQSDPSAQVKFLNFLTKLDSKKPLPGLMNAELSKDEFDKQYESMKNLTRLITYEAYLLHKERSQLSALDPKRKEIDEHLYSILSSIEDMSKDCGGAYTTHLPYVFVIANKARRELTDATSPYDTSYDDADALDQSVSVAKKIKAGALKHAFDSVEAAYQFFCVQNIQFISDQAYRVNEVHLYRGLLKNVDAKFPSIDFSVYPYGAKVDGGGDPLADGQVSFWEDKAILHKGIRTPLHKWNLFRKLKELVDQSANNLDSKDNLRLPLVPLLKEGESYPDMFYSNLNDEYCVRSDLLLSYLKSVGIFA